MPRRHTVLVVDDEADVVKSVQDLLRLEYNVLGAIRAVDGIRHMEIEEVHVIMTDQRMPGMSGVEFLERCRNEYPDAIRLLFTGYADIRAVIDAINQGNVYRYITKPWDPDELMTIIREATERYDLIIERKRLVRELQQRNQELEEANTALRKADEAHTAFVKVASHELRTPLSVLLGAIHLARTSTDGTLSRCEALDRIDHASQRLARLVDQLIQMLSIGRFDHVLERRETDISRLVQEAAEDVRPFTQLRSQTLEIDIPEAMKPLRLDEHKIRNSLNHLLLNAIKFTPDGGKVAVHVEETPGAVVIRIRDTGTGISPEDLPRIFDPFFTGFDVSHHASGQFEFGRRGIGLGLSVVKAFVEMHGGHVSVQSDLNRGTTLTVTLPRGAEANIARPVPAGHSGTL